MHVKYIIKYILSVNDGFSRLDESDNYASDIYAADNLKMRSLLFKGIGRIGRLAFILNTPMTIHTKTFLAFHAVASRFSHHDNEYCASVFVVDEFDSIRVRSLSQLAKKRYILLLGSTEKKGLGTAESDEALHPLL